jgi:hypothetical protein
VEHESGEDVSCEAVRFAIGSMPRCKDRQRFDVGEGMVRVVGVESLDYRVGINAPRYEGGLYRVPTPRSVSGAEMKGD